MYNKPVKKIKTMNKTTEKEIKEAALFILERMESLKATISVWNIKSRVEGKVRTIIAKRANRFTHAEHMLITLDGGEVRASLVGSDWKFEAVLDDAVELFNAAWEYADSDWSFAKQMIEDFFGSRDFD